MTTLDWALVIGLNGAIVVHALLGARRTESSRDWFLGGRSLPWWIVGLSAFATAIDSSDLVADSGGVYSLGISYFVTNWVGTVTGWILLAHCIALPMSLALGWDSRANVLHQEADGWLRSSQQQATLVAVSVDSPRSDALPLALGLAVIALGVALSFLIFW